MKKLFLFSFAFAGLLMAGCSSSEEIATNEEKQVYDDAPVPIMLKSGGAMSAEATTRAAINSNDDFDGKEIGVYALPLTGLDRSSLGSWSDKTILKNMKATYDKSDKSINFTTTQYYPSTADGKGQNRYAFYAYYPYTESLGTENNTTIRPELTLDGTQDVMAGLATCIYDSAYSSLFFKGDKVKLKGTVVDGKTPNDFIPNIKFKHICAKLNFKFKKSSQNGDTSPLYIDSVVIKDVTNKIFLVAKYYQGGNYVEGAEKTGSYPDSIRCTWTNSGVGIGDFYLHDTDDGSLIGDIPSEYALRLQIRGGELALQTDPSAERTAESDTVYTVEQKRKALLTPYLIPNNTEEYKQIGGSVMVPSLWEGYLHQDGDTNETNQANNFPQKGFTVYVYTRDYSQTKVKGTSEDVAISELKGTVGPPATSYYVDRLDMQNPYFKPGYAYNILIGIGGKTEITMTAEVTPWEDGGDTGAIDVE